MPVAFWKRYVFLTAAGVLMNMPAAAGSTDCYDAFVSASTSDHWHVSTHTCVNRILEQVAHEYPDKVRLSIIGSSLQGRPIYAIRITASAGGGPSWNRPASLFTGAHHGNERSGPRALLEWILWVLENPQVAGAPSASWTNQDLVDTTQIWVVPVVNPDGYEANTRHNARSTPGADWNGIDLNRNYPLTWIANSTYLTDVSGKPLDNNEGDNPLSEPETRAIVGLAATIGPQVFVDVHGHHTSINGLECSTAAGKAVFDDLSGLYNWVAAIPCADFAWNNITARFDRICTKVALGTDGLHWVWRGTAGSLPELMENHGAAFARYYSPYSDSYACDSAAATNRGSLRGPYSGEVFGYMYAGLGAASLRYEALSGRVNPTRTWQFLEGIDWWASTATEATARDVSKDSFYAFNDLAWQAPNPVPGPSAGNTAPRHNLAITRFMAMDGGCNLLGTHTPTYDTAGKLPRSRYTEFGPKTLQCVTTNWGNQTSNPFTITIRVSDLTSSTSSSSSANKTATIGGGARSHKYDYNFVEGHGYRIECELTTAGETDVAEIVVKDDQGCMAASGNLDHCVAAGSSWNAVFKTNNHRNMRVIANLNPNTTCRVGDELPVNENGFFVGHVPAISF